MQSNSPSTKTDLSRFLQKPPSILLAKFLPFSIYRQYLSIRGFYYYGINNDERKNLSNSLRYILGEKIGKIRFQFVLFKTYFGLFEHYYEKMNNAHRSLSGMVTYVNQKISISGKQWIDQVHSMKKGCIFVTGHFGAIEYVPLYLASNHYRVAMIVNYKSNKLKEALVDKSNSVNLKLIDADSPNVIFKALNAIKEGRILITLCDEIHKWRPCKKEHTHLFGHLIPKDRTLDILYRRSKVPICFGIIQRKKNGYDLCIHPIADGEEDISLCEASWKLLEHYIYQCPEQWYQWPSFYSEFTKYRMNMKCYGH